MCAQKTSDEGTVYLIRPRLGGFANDLTIQGEDKRILYHVRSKLFSPLGRTYTVYDASMQEVLKTKQDHTAMFPRHTILKKGQHIARVGQIGFIPQNYFAEMPNKPRMTDRIELFKEIFLLSDEHHVAAEIAQHRATWVVVVKPGFDTALVLSLLAIIYREYSIGG